jgi:hypothetical protein
MNNNFDSFIKEHLQDILCEAEKNHALASIRKMHIKTHKWPQLKLPHHSTIPEIPLQDCAVSNSYSQSHL